MRYRAVVRFEEGRDLRSGARVGLRACHGYAGLDKPKRLKENPAGSEGNKGSLGEEERFIGRLNGHRVLRRPHNNK
jgi:hypothetical protein